MRGPAKRHIVEPEKGVPVYKQAGVVVAGSGICGSFAAIAAARNGAKTILIDRFGQMGGNIGPAMIVAGTLLGRPPEYSGEDSLPGGFSGLSGEFKKRVEALIPPRDSEHFPERSFTASYVLWEMAREAGVEFLTASYAADPVMDGPTVKGLFVETASGRIAVLADVVVDATGEAAVAERARIRRRDPLQRPSLVDRQGGEVGLRHSVPLPPAQGHRRTARRGSWGVLYPAGP